MIKKNHVTGGHYITYVPFVDRTKRTRFVKEQMVRTPNAFIGWILDWMRGGPNPFLASPVATRIDRRLKIEKQARRANGAAASSAIGSQINAALSRYVRQAMGEADAELDSLDGYITEEENCLRACRPSEIEARLDTDLNEVLNDVNAELGPPVAAIARKQIALEQFMEHFKLPRVMHWGKPVTRQSVYLLLAITIFEFVLNTAFFAGSQRTGIVGGAALAMLLSITTIILGVGFGFAFQFSSSKAEGGGWFGRVGVGVFTLVTLYYLLLLTLARLAGEAGDLRMFETAAREIQVQPFAGLLDLPALAYFFFSIAVIAGVFYKFIDTMGHFPRLRSHRLAVEKAERLVDDIQLGMIDAAREHGEDALRALDAAPGLIQATIVPIQALVMNYENVADQHGDNLKDIQEGGKLLTEVCAGHLGVPDIPLTIDVETPRKQVIDRFKQFAARASELTNWDEVAQAALDRSRKRLSELTTEKLAEIEARCAEIRATRYAEVRELEAQTVAPAQPIPAGEPVLGVAQ
ncbi:hypothetical protein [Sphingomonas soli]|uniref:hypothetical protein n=1 Tax=Sphingomonas soli TaxID=266127 RepID=UPI0008370CA6|nr:hypothetical protein [Sphingomonas soli]